MNPQLVEQSNSVSMQNESSPEFTAALFSSGTSLSDSASLYGWLVGCWRVRVVDYHEDGTKFETEGEWHFRWVMEGRAIQDVLIVPARKLRSPQPSKERNRYGTTMRIYDPSIDAWRITWINPVTTTINHLIGKKVNDDIIHEGKDNDGALIRWSFREIHDDSFHWIGETSKDEGKTWQNWRRIVLYPNEEIMKSKCGGLRCLKIAAGF